MKINNILKKPIPYVIAFAVFLLTTVIYFSPVFKGKVLLQSDVEQFKGMSRQAVEYAEKTGEATCWIDNAFCGMPTYQITARLPYRSVLSKIDHFLFLDLPTPLHLLWLYFLGFFVLLTVLKIDWRLRIIGSLLFGFSTYLIIIIGVGHNAKAHAVAFMPVILAGVLLIFRQRHFLGFFLTALFSALELYVNHIQMTYYFAFALLFLSVFWAVKKLKTDSFKTLLKPFGLIAFAGIIAVGMNANILLPTKEYTTYSTRGKSPLTITPKGKKRENTKGLSTDYITHYSYGFAETMNLMLPNFMGGASREKLTKDSATYRFLSKKIGTRDALDFIKRVPTYWGDQPYVAAPAYIGVVCIFLFVLGLCLGRSHLQRWGVFTIVFAIVLSWGKNFSMVTDFFIAYVPLYNKFRAVSSIQVLVELILPLLAILAVQQILNGKDDRSKKLKALKKSVFIIGGALLFLLVFGGNIFSFVSPNDGGFDAQIPGFSNAFVADRKSLFHKDIIRALVLVGATFCILWAFIEQKIKTNLFLIALGGLLVFDLVQIDRKYLNEDKFINPIKTKTFVKTPVDKAILKDTTHYRVLNNTVNFMSDAKTSYFHNSIGGYHGAKLGRYQDLIDFHFSERINFGVLNMLNVKYIIFNNENNQTDVHLNVEANGNAWFVSGIKTVQNADEAIVATGKINTKKTAVLNAVDWKKLTVSPLFDALKIRDTTAQKLISKTTPKIILTDHKPNKLTYKTTTAKANLAVFSEIFYEKGWKATIDGKPVDILRANYLLRALPIPAGLHTVVFEFTPSIIKTGANITLASYGIFLLVLGLIGFNAYKKKLH